MCVRRSERTRRQNFLFRDFGKFVIGVMINLLIFVEVVGNQNNERRTSQGGDIEDEEDEEVGDEVEIETDSMDCESGEESNATEELRETEHRFITFNPPASHHNNRGVIQLGTAYLQSLTICESFGVTDSMM